LNGCVANYLMRLRGGTHVPAIAMEMLPVPPINRAEPAFSRIVLLSRQLAAHPEDAAARARLHATTARAYGITAADLRHICSTFPLVPADERAAAVDVFLAEGDGI
jgi:hypothetical protein